MLIIVRERKRVRACVCSSHCVVPSRAVALSTFTGGGVQVCRTKQKQGGDEAVVIY